MRAAERRDGVKNMTALSLSDDMKQYVSATMRSRGVDGEAATELWGLVAQCVLSQVFPSMDARHPILGELGEERRKAREKRHHLDAKHDGTV